MKFDCTKIPSEDEARSSFVCAGRYHVQIQSADDSFTKYPASIPVTFEILAGTVPGQEGKKHVEFFSTSEKAMKRLSCFVIAAGLVRPGEGREVAFASEAPGKQLVIEIEESTYQKKDGTTGPGRRVTFLGMWSLGHKDVADVPKDKEMIAIAGKVAAAGLTTAPVLAGATTEDPTYRKSAATAPATDPWNDL